MLSWIYDRDLELTKQQIADAFRNKSDEVTQISVSGRAFF